MMYEDRAVAFLDILGFKEMLDRSENNLDLLLLLRDVLYRVVELDSRRTSPTFSSALGPTYAQSFSDNIVVCGDLTWVLMNCHRLTHRLLELGVLVRGGVTFGKIWYGERVVFGPALVKAVELERLASFPRVLIDPAMIGVGDGFSWREPIEGFCRGEDGDFFLDFLKPVVDGLDYTTVPYRNIIGRLREIVCRNLESLPDGSRLKGKYTWLKSYLNSSIERLGFDWIEKLV